MARRFLMKKICILMSAAGLLGATQYASAAAFQLWEQDGASIGNYHAGAAAAAEDASTSFYNPAGLVRIKNQQFVVGVDSILTDIRYRGTINVDTVIDPNTGLPMTPQPVTGQGGGYAFVPDLHYAAPLTNNLVLGLSVSVPFGLQTNYGQDTYIRYAATKSSIRVLDFSPTMGWALNDKWSVGIGLDAQHMNGEFDQFATVLGQTYDTVSNNTGSDTAYGWHGGLLFQYSPDTRVGVSYRSQVVHHLNGTSRFNGNLANFPTQDPSGIQSSDNFTANMTLPPITTVSMFHTFNPTWDVMGTVSYVQWSVFQDFILKNVAGIINDPINGLVPSNNVNVIIHQGFRNAWNYSAGANYHVNEQWMIRTGLGFDETPVVDRNRNIQLPDSNRIAAAIGAHFQATKTIGFDAGWTHLFIANTRINNLSQTVGSETVTTNGAVTGSADVYGFQVKWDIA